MINLVSMNRISIYLFVEIIYNKCKKFSTLFEINHFDFQGILSY